MSAKLRACAHGLSIQHVPNALSLCADTICNTKDAWLTVMLCENPMGTCVNAIANDQVAAVGEDSIPS